MDTNQDTPLSSDDVNAILSNAETLANQIYSLVQNSGPPSNNAVGAALAALAHVTALVLTTNLDAFPPHMTLFISLLGRELSIQQQIDIDQTTH